MRKLQRGGEGTGAPTRTSAFNFAFELLAARTRSPGEVAPRVGEPLALVLDMKHIAVAGRVAPGGLLPGAQALRRIGNGVVGREPLLCRVQQVHAAGVGITPFLGSQQVTIGRVCTYASEHRVRGLGELIVQTHANARPILLAVDHARLCCGCAVGDQRSL